MIARSSQARSRCRLRSPNESGCNHPRMEMDLRRYALDARYGPQAIPELANGDGAFLRSRDKSVGLNFKDEEAASIDAGINSLQFEKAADHES
jgi:hypothetical protein